MLRTIPLRRCPSPGRLQVQAEKSRFGAGPSLRYFPASQTFPETISGPLSVATRPGADHASTRPQSARCSAICRTRALGTWPERMARGSAPGVRALRSVAPERECRDVFVSFRPHMPFAETSTSIDFRRGTGCVLRTMPGRGQAPAGIASARGTSIVPPRRIAKRRTVAGASLHLFGAKPRSPTEASGSITEAHCGCWDVSSRPSRAPASVCRPQRLLLPWALVSRGVLYPQRDQPKRVVSRGRLGTVRRKG